MPTDQERIQDALDKIRKYRGDAFDEDDYANKNILDLEDEASRLENEANNVLVPNSPRAQRYEAEKEIESKNPVLKRLNDAKNNNFGHVENHPDTVGGSGNYINNADNASQFTYEQALAAENKERAKEQADKDAKAKLASITDPTSNEPTMAETSTSGETINNGTSNSTNSVNSNIGNSNNSNNVATEATEDPRTNYQLKGIYQAYKDGDIDGSTAQYMAADVISNFAKDLAAGQANIAAIYNGGSPSQVGNSKSLWDKRNEEMAKQGISAEAATVKGSDKNYERLFQDKNLTALGLDNEFKQLKNFAPRELAKIANDEKQPNAMRKAAMIMVANATGNDMGAEEYAALLGSDFISKARDLGIGGALEYLISGKK